LDSSLLLGLVNRFQGSDGRLKTFTFYCGHPDYDETPWVEQMLQGSRHEACFCLLTVEEVPQLAAQVQESQDEPFGGFPTLGMAKVHARAKAEGVKVLLDGNGMDEGWAGYEYYQRPEKNDLVSGPVQGARDRTTRPECLRPEMLERAAPVRIPGPFEDNLRNMQYRDIRFVKIPRAMRFADRVSMMYSRELREPFLDHRILELGLSQPLERKIRNGQGKWLPRVVAANLLPAGVREAPKRPVQTPQREWLRGPLSHWAEGCIEDGLAGLGRGWLDQTAVRREWRAYLEKGSDNSFPVWQWISVGLMSRAC
jgi:asparagine synthase (glutamine-hydrolysing)